MKTTRVRNIIAAVTHFRDERGSRTNGKGAGSPALPTDAVGLNCGADDERLDSQKRVTPSRLQPGAPNVLIILIDDVGPGVASTYGGEVNTPTLSRIADAGISYNRFHSTAMCSPTRAALLTGRNHTVVGNGQITEFGERLGRL